MTTIFSDLHLREQSEDVCFRVLQWVFKQALADDRHVIFCGDWWHLRYQVNVRLLNRVHDVFTEWGEHGIEVDLVPGNHDQIDVSGGNALEVFSAHDSVRVWTEPGILEQDGKEGCSGAFGFVPYRKNPASQLEGLLSVAAESPAVIFSHFGLVDAQMNTGRKDSEGLALPVLGAHLVLGHYHKAQAAPGWRYVGSPYQTGFGEVGNVGGCLALNNGLFRTIEINVGAPKHFIVEWDPAVSETPPELPAWVDPAVDNVRLDIKASQETIIAGKFKNVLKASGLSDVQVNVVPVPVDRDLKLELEPGESLLHAAERFAVERLGTTDTAVPMAALRRWADGS